MKLSSIICVFVLCLFSVQLISQVNNNGLDQFGRPIQIDTTIDENDTTIVKNGFLSLFKGKPGKAALYSLLIPSGGQIYNKRWWKVPLALGIDGGLTYVLIHNRSLYKETKLLYESELKVRPDASNTKFLKEKRDYYRKWSEYAWLWLIGGHLMTVIDAYVDRHLMDFDISPDLSFTPLITPDASTNISTTISAGIKINLVKAEKTRPNPMFTSY
ncbi:MAG TPA: DUF5683 domain-containing protein [Saprospiraceae bacterium]|jgi:hypothetical protein|nr:DUF5683 domain-containing protein [Saprospiraceae bacterium]HMT69330.1 DUF5683 domain-containing protein [Saprospiraceae bacterium]HQV96316.1 DUF5683 domain-containing protein [Saprospiraceae bacterium]